jgi:hypothetical protein
MDYRILTNADGGGGLVLDAEAVMRDVERTFRDTFGIRMRRIVSGTMPVHDLNVDRNCLEHGNTGALCRLPTINPAAVGCGTALNGSDCGNRHHKAAARMFTTPWGRNDMETFRFVNYVLCGFFTLQAQGQSTHNRAFGMAMIGGRDTIVSLTYDFPNLHRMATMHEISHLFGVRDFECSPEPCVVRYPTGISDNRLTDWCRNCTNRIWSYINGTNP